MPALDAETIGERFRAAIRESVAASRLVTERSHRRLAEERGAAHAAATWHTMTRSSIALRAWLRHGGSDRFQARFAPDVETTSRVEGSDVWFRAEVEAVLAAGSERGDGGQGSFEWSSELPPIVRHRPPAAVGFGDGEEARYSTSYGQLAVRPAGIGAEWKFTPPGARAVTDSDTDARLGAILGGIEVLRELGHRASYVAAPMETPTASDPNPVRALLHHLVVPAAEAMRTEAIGSEPANAVEVALQRMTSLVLTQYELSLFLRLTDESTTPRLARTHRSSSDFSLRMSASVTPPVERRPARVALRAEVPDLLIDGPLAREMHETFLWSEFALKADTLLRVRLTKLGFLVDAERIRAWMRADTTSFLTLRLERRPTSDLNLVVLRGPFPGRENKAEMFVAMALVNIPIERSANGSMVFRDGISVVRFGPEAPFDQPTRMGDGASDVAAKLRRCLLALEAWRSPLG